MIRFVYQNKIHLALVIIFCIGSFFRLHRLTSRMAWGGDIARDYTVGYHISHFGENIALGHINSGLSNWSKNVEVHYPPYYFYFLSILISIYDSPVFVVGFFAFLQSLGIIIFYCVAQQLFDEKVGILCAILYSFSPTFMDISLTLLSAYSILPAFLLFSLLFIIGIQKKDFRFVIISLTGLTFLGTVFTGVLIFVPPFYALYVWHFRKVHKKPILFTALFSIFFFLLIHFPVIHFLGIKDFFSSFFSLSGSMENASIFLKIKNVLEIDLNASFTYPQFVLIGLGAGLTALVPFLLRENKIVFKKILLVFGLIIFAGILAGLKTGTYYDHYLYLLRPLYLLLIGAVAVHFFYRLGIQKYKEIWFILYAASLIFLITHPLNAPSYKNQFPNSEILAQRIVMLSEKQPFSYQVSAPFDPAWESSIIGSHIEKITGKKILSLSNFGENIQGFEPHEKTHFYICRSERELESCQKNIDTLLTTQTPYPYTVTAMFRWEDIPFIVYKLEAS